MGKGGVKHEAEILNEIQLLLDQQRGIISQFQILKILKKYYSELYAEGAGFKKIEREITRRNMVKKIKVNIGNLSNAQIAKAPLVSQLLSLYISPSVPDEDKRSLISMFVKNSIPNLEAPTMKRSISKELFIEHSTHFQKRPETMEFPSIQFRAILLHQFLISTFKSNPFSIQMISDLMPAHLSAQIIRSYDINPIVLSLISPLKQSYKFEIDILIPYLRPPYHPLVTKIDAVYNSIVPTAVIEIPFYNICKRFDFLNDPSSISDYWILIYSLENEKSTQFPVSISTRFEKFFAFYFEKLSIREVPFFPYQIERFSQKIGISPEIASYSIQKIFKKKLKILQCSKESYLESKLFPINGLLPFLITKSSLFKPPDPKFATSLSTPFKVDGSIECLAKLYAASQLTEEGYIINQRSNFKLFKKQVKKWIQKCTKFTNFFSSLKENESFNSLIKHEMALLIEEMKFPSLYFNRIDLKPIKTITLKLDSENEEEDQNGNENENDSKDDKKDELDDGDDVDNQNDQMPILRSVSANFKTESSKQVNRILQSPSLSLIKQSISRPKLSNLNDIFTKSFPHFTKEEFFKQGPPQKKQGNDDDDGILPFHSLYFQDNETDFPTAYAIDSPLNSDPSNDEVIEEPSIYDSEKVEGECDKERKSFNDEEIENESNNEQQNDFKDENNNENDDENNNENENKDYENENRFTENKSDESENDFNEGENENKFNRNENNDYESEDGGYEGENENKFNENDDYGNFDENHDPISSFNDENASSFFNGRHSSENDEDDLHRNAEEEEDYASPTRHIYSSFDEDYDSVIEYPVHDQSDFSEGTETEFLSLFQINKRLLDAEVSVSVAVEFIKIILSTPSSPKSNDLKLRQTVHFSQKDVLDAIWFLSSINVYQHKNVVKFPDNDWELPLPENSFPRPIFIAYCDDSIANDPIPLKIVWSKTTVIDSVSDNEDGEDEEDEYDLVDGVDDDFFAADQKGSSEYITFHFKNITFREQISAFKKEKQTFRFERQRFNFPKLPDFNVMKRFQFNPDQLYDQLYNSDPLSQFCFGQYENEIPNLENFPCRFIMNLVNSSGVFGLSLTDIVHSFGFSPFNCDDIISSVKLLCTLNFICRVPSSRLVPRYTRFIPCNTICRPINNKIELVSPHIWINFDGFINEEVKVNLIKNISTFIFAHEFCDFIILIEEFPYVSPYDLCLILQVLECDEIIFSQYFKKIKPDLFEDEENIPIPPFGSIEKFLIVLDDQRKNNENNISYHRILRTNRSMLPNLCVLNNC